MKKVVLIFLQQQGSIATRILQLIESKECTDEANQDQDLLNICGDLFHLIDFIELNLTAACKILKKHDHVLRGARELSTRYLFQPSNDHSQLGPLLEYAGLDAIIRTKGSRIWLGPSLWIL